MIEQGIYNLLAGNAGLTAIVGDRIYPVVVPEPTVYPCLSYTGITSSSAYTFDRRSHDTKRIQFDAWATSYSDAKSILHALKLALDTLSGTLSDGTRLLAAFSDQEIDHFESDGRIYRSLAEYTFEYIEAA